VRSIAAAAGVSPGLVQHHYRTKEDLRRAVDRHVVERAAGLLLDPAGDGDPSEVTRQLGARIGELMRSDPDLSAYVRRSLVAADALGLELFDGLVAIAASQLERMASEGLLHSELDLTWAALHVVLMNVSTLILEEAIDRHLDQPVLSHEGLKRWRDATGVLFAKGQFRRHRSRSREPMLAESDSPARSRPRSPHS
jgi:AcrR family transcriptional regulator